MHHTQQNIANNSNSCTRRFYFAKKKMLVLLFSIKLLLTQAQYICNNNMSIFSEQSLKSFKHYNPKPLYLTSKFEEMAVCEDVNLSKNKISVINIFMLMFNIHK